MEVPFVSTKFCWPSGIVLGQPHWRLKMESVELFCPNGHRLVGSTEMVGRHVRCMKCQVKFPFVMPMKKSLTATGVQRILGVVSPVPMPPEAALPTKRQCPRCFKIISVNANVCEHCVCYVGEMPHFLRQTIAEGKSLDGR